MVKFRSLIWMLCMVLLSSFVLADTYHNETYPLAPLGIANACNAPDLWGMVINTTNTSLSIIGVQADASTGAVVNCSIAEKGGTMITSGTLLANKTCFFEYPVPMNPSKQYTAVLACNGNDMMYEGGVYPQDSGEINWVKGNAGADYAGTDTNARGIVGIYYTSNETASSSSFNINLISPINNTYNNTYEQIFYFNYTYNETADTCSLWTDESGSFVQEEINKDTIICYQETANISTACGGLDSGIYSGLTANSIDGDWGTTGGTTTAYYNYTIPLNTVGAFWYIKLGAGIIYNHSIPSQCLDGQTILRLVTSKYSAIFPAVPGHSMSCINSTGTYFNLDLGENVADGIYEEAVYWNLSSPPLNTTLNIPHNFTSDGTYIWNIGCNISNGTTYFADSNRSLTIDIVSPVIVSDIINNTITLFENISYTINVTDDNLYSFLAMMNDNIITNQTGISSPFQYNLTYNYSNLNAGVNHLYIKTADGHTAKALWQDYIYTKGILNNNIKFKLPDNQIIISTESGSIFDTFTAKQEKDRYSFDYNPNNKNKQNYVFIVESEKYIDIITNKDTKWATWLVTGNNWIDFYEADRPKEIPSYKRLSDNMVEVTINQKQDKSNIFSFSSIGDLNIVELNYTIYKLNASAVFSSTVIESQTQTLTLNISKILSLGLTTSGRLFYNNVSYPMTKLYNFDDHDYHTVSITTPQNSGSDVQTNILSFEYNITGTSNIIGNLTYNQTVYKINVGDCSNASWAKALTFIGYDEENSGTTILNNLSLKIDLSVWFESLNQFNNFSFNFIGNRSNHSLCLYPNETTYYLNAVMEYKDLGNKTVDGLAYAYTDRKYYLNNYTLRQSNDTINLYNLVTAKASTILLKVYDQLTGAAVQGAYVKILRYYPELGVYKTVEIEKTDVTGQTIGKMVLYDVFYKFIVEKDQVVVLNSDVEKIASTTKLLPVSITDDVLESFRKLGSVSTSVTCTNATRVCRFTWSDSQNIVQTATLNIYKMSGFGQTLENTQTTESVAGTMAYTVPDDGFSYMAEGILHSNTEFSALTGALAWLTAPSDLALWGGISILFPVMLLMISLVFAFIGIGAIGVIGASLLVLLAASIAGWLPVTIYWVISFVVLGGLLIAKIRQ